MTTSVRTTVRIPTPLRAYTSRQSSVELVGNTVQEAMLDLTAQHPDLQSHIFEESGELRSYVNLFLNEEDIRVFDGIQTALKPGDRLAIIPAIAGGRGDDPTEPHRLSVRTVQFSPPTRMVTDQLGRTGTGVGVYRYWVGQVRAPNHNPDEDHPYPERRDASHQSSCYPNPHASAIATGGGGKNESVRRRWSADYQIPTTREQVR